MKTINLDCRHYIGEKPCQYGNHCSGCPHYDPITTRILIIKLGALGDALRTTAILPGLKKAFPGAEITWATDSESYPLLKMVPAIDRLFRLEGMTPLNLTTENFDLVLSFDKALEALSLAKAVSSPDKRGFSKTPLGKLGIFNEASFYSLQLGVDDQLKFFENTLTYQEMIYQMAELPYGGEKYTLEIPPEAREEAEKMAESWGLKEGDPVVGLNTGSGERFQSKQWSEEAFLELIHLIGERDTKILLLGGKAEKERNERLSQASQGRAVYTGVHSLSTFAALVDHCGSVVTADTLAMHIALGLSKYTVALFGPTCSAEVDLFGRGQKVIGIEECSPCYLQFCKLEKSCVEKISTQEVFEALQGWYNGG